MREIITLSLLTAFLISCDRPQEESVSYFGGKILNPNNRYVVLFKNNSPVDTAMLDNNNRFLIKLNNVEEGLYHFEHKPEYQYVFIEKGDSILMRLNTYDFDESLVFTGKGAEKNNFLIEMYLMNEDEERLIYKYNKLDAEDFRAKMDSLRAMKMEQYKTFIGDHNLSENAKNITRAGIDYIHYATMELYPYMHKNLNNLDKIRDLPHDFYVYRNTLNTNDHRLSYFRPYFNYMMAKMNNLSYVYHTKNLKSESVAAMQDGPQSVDIHMDPGKRTVSVEKTLPYHMYTLHLVDSLVEDPDLKDNLYRNIAYFYFLSGMHPENDNEIFLEKFNALCGNEAHVERIDQLYKSIQRLQPGKSLPAVALINTNGDAVAMENISITANRVFYFWSSEWEDHIKEISQKIKKLEKKYPSYRFTGINIADHNHKKWLKYINAFCLNADNQFRAEDSKKLRETLVVNTINKIIITQGNGTIIDAFVNLYDKDIETTLQKYQKKIQ